MFTEAPLRSSFRQVATTDLLELGRDRRLVATVVACWVLWGLALALSIDEHLQTTADRDLATEASREAWLSQGQRNPHDAGHWGTFLFRERTPLALLDPGIEPAIGSWIRLETHTQHDADGRPLDAATQEARWSAVHPAFVLGTLVPLLIVILLHDRVCGDREDGRWSLLLVSGLSRRDLVTGKILAASVVGAVVVTPMLLSGATAVLFVSQDTDLVRVISWAGAAALYTVTWILLGLAISAAMNTRSRALLLGVAVWFFGVVALPRVAVSVAEAVHPAPSAWGFARSVEQLQDDRWTIPYRASVSFNAIYSRIESEWMTKQGVSDPALLTVDPFGFAIEETEEQGQRAYDRTYGDLVRTFEQQDEVTRLIGLLTPAVAFGRFSAGLAESDLAAHQRFQEEAESYRRAMMLTLNMAVAHRGRERPMTEGSRMDGSFEADRRLWESIPPFRPEGRSTSEVLTSVRGDLVSLLAQALAALTLACVLIKAR